ncbi:MAG: hypothetical protein KDK36_06480 [Leptospiraceae bacterium]|nr:hypothetical protein [Leptospiraceae bacterium]
MPSTLVDYAIQTHFLPEEFYIIFESIGGKMDQKFHVLKDNNLYLFDNLLYNKNEAGNLVWGAVNAYLGVFSPELAQAYADIASIYVNNRRDEEYDQRAIRRGWYYYDQDFKVFYK